VPPKKQCGHEKGRRKPGMLPLRQCKSRGRIPPLNPTPWRRGVTPPIMSSPCVTPPPFSDIPGRQVRIVVGVHRSKWTQIGIGPPASLPQQLRFVLIMSNSEWMGILPIVKEFTHLSRGFACPTGFCGRHVHRGRDGEGVLDEF
jgi:hypothetical protein